MRELRIRKARKAAADLLHRHGAGDALPVPVEEIAKAEGARIESGGIEGALGLLVRTRKPWILTSSNHDHPGQYLFTVAHELGHLWLDHPGLEVCTRRSVVDGHRDHEAEANAFAAELLLPEQTVRRRCEVSPVDLDVVRGIADESGASLVCAAIRFVELTSERCAVVLSQSGTVTWAVRSALF